MATRPRKQAKQPKQERSRATVRAIVEATGRVMGEQGLERTTVARVAERAGVSVGSLYQYFPDKRALMSAYFARRLREDIDLVESLAVAAEELPVPEVIRRCAEATMQRYREERELYRGLGEVLPLVEQTPQVRATLEHAIEVCAAFFRSRRGEIGDCDPELLARTLFHSVRGALYRLVTESPELLDDPDLADVLVGGVGALCDRSSG